MANFKRESEEKRDQRDTIIERVIMREWFIERNKGERVNIPSIIGKMGGVMRVY